MTSPIARAKSHLTHYRTAAVNGRKVFYHEAGDPGSPTIVLLHGLPTSSQMFRELIPALADQFHLIAPDYIGFGHSDAPSGKDFEYTFDNLAAHVRGLLDQLGLTSYILYMQDYGGPVGFRLFAEKPEQVSGFIIQNANAYMDGVGDAPKKVLLPLWENCTPETEKPAREFVSLEGTKFHWLVGAKDPEAVNPDNWAKLSRFHQVFPPVLLGSLGQRGRRTNRCHKIFGRRHGHPVVSIDVMTLRRNRAAVSRPARGCEAELEARQSYIAMRGPLFLGRHRHCRNAC